jgi:hypothetical protein
VLKDVNEKADKTSPSSRKTEVKTNPTCKVLYFDKKVTRLPLRGEAQSSLNTFNAGDKVITPKRVTPQIVPQSIAAINGQ